MSEPGHLGVKRAESAKLRRAEQLKRWKGSLTELEPVTPARSRHRGGPRVRFEDGAVFLAACSSGDTEEVKRLLARGARLNTANVDGLTALHQACIDENLDMVKFLVEYGANVNQQDNEGWTPLHAVASCGYLNIAEYLISRGANVAAVNSEGEVPSDLAEEAAMKDLLMEQVKKQGIDLDHARKAEEQQMLQDARQWLNRWKIEDRKQPRTGATALHVAAAKGYSEVMRLLIQAGFDVNVQDNDGWTPLHAAAHWGVKEACSILAEALCDMDIRNKLGQTPFDVADEGLVEHLEMLQKKQNMLRSEENRNKLIEADMNGKLQSGLFRNKEKILYEPDTLKSLDHEEENKDSSSSSSEEEAEEDDASESDTEKEAERKEESIANHSSHESQTLITEQVPPPEHNTFTMAPVRKFTTSLLNKSEEQKDESPSSWRLSLRKTSSQNTLNEGTVPRDALTDKGGSIYRSSSSPRISALLDNKEKQDKDNKIYFASIAPRRLNSTGDLEEKENRESAVTLVRSGSYTRPLWRDEPKANEAPATGAPSTYVSTYMKSASFGRSSDLSSPYISANRNASPATSPTVLGSSTSLGTECQLASCPPSVSSNATASGRQYTRTPYRQQMDPAVEKGTESISSSIPLSVITNVAVSSTANGVTTANSNSTTRTESSPGDARDRRRSYLTPVRDEEAESLRKARSRQARQTRRSTQGVTLTDLQEAERTFSRSRTERQTQEQPNEKSERTETTEGSCEREQETTTREPKETLSRWSRNLDEESVSHRLRCPAPDKATNPISPSVTPFLYSSSHLPRTSRSVASDSVNPTGFQTASVSDMEKNEYDDQDLDDRSSNKQSVRERRRPKERRRGTGISFFTNEDEDLGGTEEVKEARHERLSRLDTASSSSGTSDNYGDRPSGRSSAYTRRENRLAALSSRTEDDSSRDYKKLYESALSENQKLKSKLQDAQVELADIKSKLDKIAQKQEKTSDRSSMLEMEKREKRALERKLSEMEEEMKNLHQLKQIHTLRQMNEQLLAENRALTRVVARLSQSAEPPESEEL
ncbi:protein phosphatase 1 regulatory subunit 12B isoform X3 [Eublepharis macularius]|uniref:Protein phosphatase 1 regulatory subunit n=1 Tax=Eublepharis macularius TaxID=481883 RepID=A0AA97JHL9_EUBMA|nr:protein phosphatase 1 regulatory subunit 12B isoform X3 [Eublepharis macularius]